MSSSTKEDVDYFVKNRIPEVINRILQPLLTSHTVTPVKTIFKEIETMDFNQEQVEPKIVFVLGGPGSGKGTQCEKLVKQYGCMHFSAGDLLRDEVKSGSSQGVMLDTMMKEGKIVPGHITIGLLKRKIQSASGTSQWILVDGFPRDMAQGIDFEKSVGVAQFCLFFDAPDPILVDRLLSRAKVSGRSDDNEETIRKRLVTFHSQSLPVIEYFRATNRLYEISASGSVDEVWSNVLPLFVTPASYPKIVFVLGGPGCGKGTQCANLVQKYRCAHLSAGDLLREAVAEGSEQGKMLDKMMKEGQIVPGHITIGLLRRAICRFHLKSPFVLIDGFPREMGQAFSFEHTVTPCFTVLSFHVPDEVLIQRLLKRAESSGRADDNLETIQKRITTFHRQSEPVIRYYEAIGKLQNIEATEDVNTVWNKVSAAFGKLGF